MKFKKNCFTQTALVVLLSCLWAASFSVLEVCFSKDQSGKKADKCLTEDEIIEILKEKKPNAKVMMLRADFVGKGLHYEGRLFEESETNKPQNSQYVTKTKYEFEINAENGRFITWNQQNYQFPKSRTESLPDEILTREKARELAEAKVPGASVTALQWDMNKDYVFYAGFMYKDDVFYSFVIDAYTGDFLYFKERASKAEIQDKIRQAIMSQTQAERIVLSKVPGAAVLNLNLQWLEERPFYSGKLAKGHFGYTFTLDAFSGQIISWKQENLGRGVDVRTSHRYGPGLPVIPSRPIVTPPTVPPIPRLPRIPSIQPF
ncbi:MAG: PepSY domain-containing protein [Thermoguttaceae bacterium]|nr:PepSY domain-containing protein [Thermoguttaceae bacterium]